MVPTSLCGEVGEGLLWHVLSGSTHFTHFFILSWFAPPSLSSFIILKLMYNQAASVKCLALKWATTDFISNKMKKRCHAFLLLLICGQSKEFMFLS
jgi:hypothetical protein